MDSTGDDSGVSEGRCRSAGKVERDAGRRQGAGEGRRDKSDSVLDFRFLNFDFRFPEEVWTLLDF